MEEAVERQMIADVPVGVYLSGGVDSSIILASASKLGGKIKTFSVGFDLESGEDEKKFNQDFNLARNTANHFNTEHKELLVDSRYVAENLEKIIGSMDDPISNPTAVPMFALANFAKEHVTVVLSGDGGDELFGGYERYRMGRRADVIGKVPLAKYVLPLRIRKALEMSALDRLAQFEFEKDFRLKRVIRDEFFLSMNEVKKDFERYIIAEEKTEALMMADLSSWLPDQAFLLGDKMSMQGSVEDRVPFCDRDVVNLALSLPLSYKVTPFKTKKILKDAFADVLPKELLNQPKRGWFSPGAKWLRRPDVEMVVKNILSPSYNEATRGIFDWAGIEYMLARHLDKSEYNLTILWAIMTFQIWAKKNSIKHE